MPRTTTGASVPQPHFHGRKEHPNETRSAPTQPNTRSADAVNADTRSTHLASADKKRTFLVDTRDDNSCEAFARPIPQLL